MGRDDHIKRAVPADKYLATIVHAEFDKNKFYLWWVIDTGKHVGHKISQEFPCSEAGERLMKKMCKRIKITYRPGVSKPNKIYPKQFICKRAKITVAIRHFDAKYIRNVITYHEPALHRPEENVAKPKSVKHFFKEKTGRKLPL